MAAKPIKKLGVFQTEFGQAFFKGSQLIGYVHENDAEWQHEFFDEILEEFGIEVEELDELTEDQQALVQLAENGETDEDAGDDDLDD